MLTRIAPLSFYSLRWVLQSLNLMEGLFVIFFYLFARALSDWGIEVVKNQFTQLLHFRSKAKSFTHYSALFLPSLLSITAFFCHQTLLLTFLHTLISQLRLPTLWTLVCGHCNQIWLYCSHQARGEMAVREEFPEATIVRPATCFGHEDHFLNYYACKLFCWRLSGKRLPPTPNSVICTIS